MALQVMKALQLMLHSLQCVSMAFKHRWTPTR